MARRPSRAGRTPARVPAPGPLNAPFKDLGRELRRRPPAARPPVATRGEIADVPGDPALFERAMEGVVPLARGTRARVGLPGPAPGGRSPTSEEAEALAALSDLVRGTAAFDITETREYVEGLAVSVDPRLVRKLRQGAFAWQAHVDLHGMNAEAARGTVDRFLSESVRAGLRCVLIVHGRGLNSKDHTPVLKERLKTWLSRGRAARAVLAFASARPCDGGAGAVYVLLRRDRRRGAIRVNEGAKR